MRSTRGRRWRWFRVRADVRAAALAGGIAVFMLAGCRACDGKDDIAGTYVVSGTLEVKKDTGSVVERVAIKDEKVSLVLTTRHYQYGDWAITVRGCTMKSSNGKIDEIAATVDECSFDAQNGPIHVQAYASGKAIPGTDDIELHVRGPMKADAGSFGSFDYSVRGKLQKPPK